MFTVAVTVWTAVHDGKSFVVQTVTVTVLPDVPAVPEKVPS